MKIKEIEIKGLWNLYNIKWSLNEYVNILSGANGSGKTTISHIIIALLSNNSKTLKKADKYMQRIDSAVILFEDDTQLCFERFDTNLETLKKKASEDVLYEELWGNLSKNYDVEKFPNELNKVEIQTAVSYLQKNGEKLQMHGYFKDVYFDYVDTFDFALTEDMIPLLKDFNLSALDICIDNAQKRYAYYLSDLATQLEHHIVESIENNQSDDFIKNVYSQKYLFMDIIDDFFSDTNKKIDRSKSTLKFILNKPNITIDVDDLSSGERQLLYIFITILLQKRKDSIIVMDEPEISLHVSWQRKLINKILLLNPNCQLLILTHAPSLILEGWHSAVKNISEIMSENNE